MQSRTLTESFFWKTCFEARPGRAADQSIVYVVDSTPNMQLIRKSSLATECEFLMFCPIMIQAIMKAL